MELVQKNALCARDRLKRVFEKETCDHVIVDLARIAMFMNYTDWLPTINRWLERWRPILDHAYPLFKDADPVPFLRHWSQAEQHEVSMVGSWGVLAAAANALGDHEYTEEYLRVWRRDYGLVSFNPHSTGFKHLSDRRTLRVLQDILSNGPGPQVYVARATLYGMTTEDYWSFKGYDEIDAPPPDAEYWIRWIEENEPYVEYIPEEATPNNIVRWHRSGWWRVNEAAKAKKEPVVDPYKRFPQVVRGAPEAAGS